MDFWDVARLMWRRWYVTVPMLFITAIGAAWTAANVSPDYQVTAHVAMVGSNAPQVEGESNNQVVNPWSTEALAEAATIRLGGQALAEELEAAGYQAEWSLGVTGRQPWLTMEVVAKTPEQAQATVDRLREIIEEEVQSRQDAYNIPPDRQITAVTFDEGETVEMVTGKLRRALVAIVAAGLVLTMGVTVAFDAIQRRRERSVAPAPEEPHRARYTFPVDFPASRADPAADATAAGERSPVTAGAESKRNGAIGLSAADHTEPPTHETAAPRPVEPTTARGASRPLRTSGESYSPVPDDSTVVLPLSNRPWAGQPPAHPHGNGNQERPT